jgi:hypothetical protein
MSEIKQIDAESIDKTFSDSIGVFPPNVYATHNIF